MKHASEIYLSCAVWLLFLSLGAALAFRDDAFGWIIGFLAVSLMFALLAGRARTVREVNKTRGRA